MVKKVKEIFCPKCGSANTGYDSSELADGDDMWTICKEWRTCKNCGNEFRLITEWKLQGFTFYGEDGKLEDIDYEIEEE